MTHWLIPTPSLTAATKIQHAKIAQYAMKNTTIEVEAKPNSHIDTSDTYLTTFDSLFLEHAA